MTLTCPKCGGAMRSYERNGITVDQCTDCRGIFLDRGELERLVDAENGRITAGGGDMSASSRPDRDQSGGHEYGGSDGPGQRRRGGFLGDLFDFD